MDYRKEARTTIVGKNFTTNRIQIHPKKEGLKWVNSRYLGHLGRHGLQRGPKRLPRPSQETAKTRQKVPMRPARRSLRPPRRVKSPKTLTRDSMDAQQACLGRQKASIIVQAPAQRAPKGFQNPPGEAAERPRSQFVVPRRLKMHPRGRQDRKGQERIGGNQTRQSKPR